MPTTETSEQIIKTPVEYEAISKTVYNAGGGIVCKVDEHTANFDTDDSIGQQQWDELCDEVGNAIANALNRTAEQDRRVKELGAENVRLREREKQYKLMLSNTFEISVNDWLISNNRNPNGLVALRQFNSEGEVLSYTHHDTALEAYEALAESKQTEVEL